MKTLCLFASYFSRRDIPYYITIYLNELKKYYGDIIFLTSEKHLSEKSNEFLKGENISYLLVENRGFDFGQWYQAIQKVNLEKYDRLVLVNDSCILFRSLNEFTYWAANSHANVKGITGSDAIYPHIQSYFLVFDKKAMLLAKAYFEKNKILETISEVISTYEVGLSKYLKENGMQLAAFIDNNGYSGEFSPYYMCVDYHLSKGIPMIKKKIIFSSYRKPELFTLARMNFNINPEYYLEKISKYKSDLIIDLDKLRKQKKSLSLFEIVKYNFIRKFIQVFRPIYKRLTIAIL